MSRFLCLSITSVAACSSGPDCGPNGAAEFGITAGNDMVTLVYGDLVSGLNNDCPDPMAPSGVISVTINGVQMGGTGLVTFCVPRPDLLATGAQPLGQSGVRPIDMTGDAGGCTLSLQSAFVPSGTVKSEGLCDNGSNAAGFALIIDGALGLQRNCGGTLDQQIVTVRGTVAVKPQT
jgi:hypothetical protein